MSNHDKARVVLALAGASLQSPVLMHLDYRLPGYSFTVRRKHKLIPSCLWLV